MTCRFRQTENAALYERLRQLIPALPLSRASERLNEQLQQAHGVRRHLERGMIVRDDEAPPASAPGQATPEG